MPTGPSETIETFAFEGLLSAGGACALAVAVAALAGWLLWRERGIVGGRWAVLFWGLRVAAVAVVAWMLAGPTQLRTERASLPQSIAVVVDSSASMSVVDPEKPSADLRWLLAATDDASAVTACDRAVVALVAAASAGEAIRAGIDEHQPRRQIQSQLTSIRKLCDRAATLFNEALDRFASGDRTLTARAERIASLLSDPVSKAIEHADELLASGGDRASLNEAAASLADLVGGACRRAESLAADVAERSAASNSTAAAATRAERAAALLAALERGALDDLSEECRIRRLRFDGEVTPMANADWETPDESAMLEPGRGDGATLRLVADNLETTPTEAAGPAATDLSAVLEALEKLRASEPLRMAIVVTDGRHNAPESASPQEIAARLEGLPVHVAPIGVTIPARDVLIHRVEAPTAVTQNDTAEIEVLISAFDCGGERLTVTLRRDGAEVDRRTIDVDRDRADRKLAFRVAAGELGVQQYEIEVEPVDDEASLTNNLSAAAIEVVRDKLRVLLADRGPRYEYRYLQNLFRRDKHVEFDEFLTLPELTATGSREASASLPDTVEEWSEYDIVLLGDLGPEHLTVNRQESLIEYVREGGGNVILIAGQQHMPASYRLAPLAELAPVEEGPPVDPRVGYAVEIADRAGVASAVLIRDSITESRQAWASTFRLAPIYGLSRFNLPKKNSEMLLEATPLERGGLATRGEDRRPALMCWAPVGAGRVAYLAAPQTYLLRFRRGDRDHHRFWGQTLRWITAARVGAGSDRIRMETDRNSYEHGQSVEVTVWLSDKQGRPVKDAEFSVEARSLGEPLAEAAMRPDGDVAGRYVGALRRLPIGAYEIAPTGPIVDELVADQSERELIATLINVQSSGGIELANTQSNLPLLEQIAELTGGQVLPPTAVAEAFQLVSLDPEVTETTHRQPIWDRWSNLLIVLGCLFTEWIVRKHKGLT